MIKWSDLAACLGSGDEMPFCLETIPQLRRWCVGGVRHRHKRRAEVGEDGQDPAVCPSKTRYEMA